MRVAHKEFVMITQSLIDTTAYFMAHATDMAGDAYSDGCEAFDHGDCTEAEQAQLDTNYELAEGRMDMICEHYIDLSFQREHELEMQAFIEECHAAYKADLDYETACYVEHGYSMPEPGFDDCPF